MRIDRFEVDALGVMNISRGCFERCCSNKHTPQYHSNTSFVTLRSRRPTLLGAVEPEQVAAQAQSAAEAARVKPDIFISVIG